MTRTPETSPRAWPAVSPLGTAGPFGQAIVEFALIVPLMFALMLAFAELAFMHATLHTYQNGAEVLADWAAGAHARFGDLPPSWPTIVAEEQQRTGCTAEPVVTYPDGTHVAGDRVLVDWPCRYTFNLTRAIESIPMPVHSEAVVP